MTATPSSSFTALLCLSLALAVPCVTSAAEPVAVNRTAQPIKGQYLVRFKSQVKDAGQEGRLMATQAGGQVLHTYRNALNGVNIRVPAHMAATLEAALMRNPNVESFEPDMTASINEALIMPTVSQSNATWGLDRIDQSSLPLSGTYRYQYSGNGVFAFVIDTGILQGHNEFAGRVINGYDAIGDGQGTNDCNGHGTHVAGTIGGQTLGVAKAVTLVPVRVLDCSGSGSLGGVIAGLDWTAGQSALRPAVANMSLGSSKSTTVNAAVAGAVSKGVSVVVAAGNNNANACNYSPASEPTAITVGATTSSDSRSSFSNYGSCLDVFAPGSSITSAYYTSTIATAVLSGTSMASPHVAGVASLALAANPTATPDMVTRFVLDNATTGKVISAGSGSPNRLVYSMASGAPSTPVVTTVRVTNLLGSGRKINNKSWQAQVVATVRDLTGNPVANATVAGTFIPGGSKSCLTSSTGSCSVSSSNLDYRTVTYSTFTVSGISGTNLSYDSSQNTSSQVVVNRP